LVEAVREANRYFEKRQPWTLAKNGAKEELGTTLYWAAEALRIVSGALEPVMPRKMAELRETLGISPGASRVEDLRTWGGLKPGARVRGTRSLFPRVAVEPAAGAGGRKSEDATGKERKMETPGTVAIEYAEFAKAQLRTAKVVQAEKVQGADKLLKLQIEMGGETRQIVAGIAMHYKPEDLPGKTIVVVANLKPAKIRGVESNGMLLAAVSDAGVRVVTVDGDVGSGVPVK
jgi:methionyl-tRNA synthetase